MKPTAPRRSTRWVAACPSSCEIPVFIALYWVLLGRRRDAPCAVAGLDSGPVGEGPVLHPADHHGCVHADPDEVSNPTPPDPIQAKVMMACRSSSPSCSCGSRRVWCCAEQHPSIAQQWQITRMIESAKPGTCGRLTRLPRSRRHRGAAASVSSASRGAGLGAPLFRQGWREPKPRTAHFTRVFSMQTSASSTKASCCICGAGVLHRRGRARALQGHGGPVVMQMLLERCLVAGRAGLAGAR